MGEKIQLPVPSFNKSVRIEGRDERLTSDAGVMLLREGMERIGIVPWLVDRLADPRDPRYVTHPLAELLRTSVLLLGQGWGDQDDADRLRKDAALNVASASGKGADPVEKSLASQPTLSRLAEMLSTEANRKVLRDGLVVVAGRRIRAMRGCRFHQVVVDVDSLPVPVEGSQPGSIYNGHYHERIYHPLVASVAETGDLVDLQLREGNVHTADGDLEFILPLLDLVEREMCVKAALRIDAGFPDEELLSGLESRGTDYVARLRNNRALDRLAQPYVDSCIRPDREDGLMTWFFEEKYRAGPWSQERRVVLVVQERDGEMIPHHFWLVTSWPQERIPDWHLLPIYRQRGTAEGFMGEFMDVVEPMLSSSPRPKSHYRGEVPEKRKESVDSFAVNEVRLLLAAMAYNVMHIVRTLAEAQTHVGWSLGRVREQLLKVGARILTHGRRIVIVITGPSIELWQGVWRGFQRFHLPIIASPGG